MRKYDCFTFLNGFDILKLRLSELADSIDWFVLVESTHTFQGIPKPLYFKENPITGYKIHHVIVEPRHVGPWLNKDELAWDNNKQQVADGYAIGLKDADASDVGFFGDFDEIPRPSKLMEGPLDMPTVFKMDLYEYWLNMKVQAQVPATARHLLGSAKANLQGAALTRFAGHEKYWVENGGWHLRSFGTPELLYEKFIAYPEHAYTTFDSGKSNHSVADIESYMHEGISLFTSSGRIYSFHSLEKDLPDVVLKNPKEWEMLMHPDYRNN